MGTFGHGDTSNFTKTFSQSGQLIWWKSRPDRNLIVFDFTFEKDMKPRITTSLKWPPLSVSFSVLHDNNRFDAGVLEYASKTDP